MSAIVHYSFFLESEAGTAADNLTPSFVFIKNIPDGNAVDFSTISINNLGDGLYGFSLDWSLYDTVREDGSRNSLFIKINTGLQTADQKYLTMRVERQDYLPELVDNIQLSADTLNSSATNLAETASSILRIEEGHWVISNHTLYVYDKAIPEIERTVENASHIFALYNANGEPTSQDIYQRININPEG